MVCNTAQRQLWRLAHLSMLGGQQMVAAHKPAVLRVMNPAVEVAS